jgi:agmatine/peptidylarginine deiminase
MQSANYTLLPEWAEQEAVLLAWPHQDTDWCDNLPHVQNTYIELIKAINKTESVVLLLCPASIANDVKTLLTQQIDEQSQVLIITCDYDDTWVRDYGFLTVSDNRNNFPISFEFNGWGQKFDAAHDNQVNVHLAQLCQQKLISVPTVLEGGAIEIDENQHLLSTGSCLFNPKRNGRMDDDAYKTLFQQFLGAKQVSIFKHGHLEGDDTDGHIDTLARFTPLMGIVLQCADNRPQDPHFAELFKLQYEISQVLPKHKIYPLPLPFVVNADGQRLPASYANFLILNRHILMPIYGQAEDDTAVYEIQKAYPNYAIIQIDCRALVQQNGSLHCVTMQIPQGTLKADVLEQARQGVTIQQLT